MATMRKKIPKHGTAIRATECARSGSEKHLVKRRVIMEFEEFGEAKWAY